MEKFVVKSIGGIPANYFPLVSPKAKNFFLIKDAMRLLGKSIKCYTDDLSLIETAFWIFFVLSREIRCAINCMLQKTYVSQYALNYKFFRDPSPARYYFFCVFVCVKSLVNHEQPGVYSCLSCTCLNPSYFYSYPKSWFTCIQLCLNIDQTSFFNQILNLYYSPSYLNSQTRVDLKLLGLKPAFSDYFSHILRFTLNRFQELIIFFIVYKISPKKIQKLKFFQSKVTYLILLEHFVFAQKYRFFSSQARPKPEGRSVSFSGIRLGKKKRGGKIQRRER